MTTKQAVYTMNIMGKLLKIIRRKPLILLLVSLIYLFLVGLAKWKITPPLSALWYLAGGILGIYFLELAEEFFQLTPSPFRSAIFAALYVAVSLFIITSSRSPGASGLVLSLYLSLILGQIGEWRTKGNLNSWFNMIEGAVEPATQSWLMTAFFAFFLVETYLFIH